MKSKIRDYLKQDIDILSSEDVRKLYNYVRRHLIANIEGLKDPLERSGNSDYTKCPACGEISLMAGECNECGYAGYNDK